MHSASILVIEDDPATSSVLRARLKSAGFSVEVADDGLAGLELARREPRFDAIILDIMLPNMSGFDVLRNMRLEGIRSKVVVLSARSDLEDRVRGLREGADDYIPKPFDLREVCLRIENLLKVSAASLGRIEVGDMVISRRHRTVGRAGVTEELTVREFELLLYLIEHHGKTVSKKDLLRDVWQSHFDRDPNVVNVHLSHLRRKLDRKGLRQPIETIQGVGVRLVNSTQR